MAQRKKWSDMTPPERAGAGMVGIVQFALMAAALWDMWHRSEEEINGDRRIWTAAAFVNFIGPIAYFLFGRKPPLWERIRAATASEEV